MDYFTLCVTFISLLLGIAYPILIQITSEDKYSSEAILDLFEKNIKRKLFIFNLISSLILTLFSFLELPPFFSFDIKILDYLLNNSAKILLLISTLFLIINFFGLINLIQTFYRTSKLVGFLEKKRKEVLGENNFTSFEGMSDILFWSVRNQNITIAKKVSDYFGGIFVDYRTNWIENNKDTKEGIIYPDLFYAVVYNTIEQGTRQNENTFKFLEVRTSGLIWLVGQYNTPKISESTYVWMWRNIILAIENNRLDLVFMHWTTAHQYFRMDLDYITPEYDYSKDELTAINQELIDERTKERELFLEFHYALGGLLLYRNEIKFIKKLFEYTTSQPPQYPLLPISMNEIFNMFFRFFDPYERNFPWITNKYYFPGLDGMKAQGLIKRWVCEYIGVLFLRQFNIQTYLSNQNPKENPNLPNTTEEKRHWLNNINYFREIIEKLLENEELIKKLNFKIDEGYVDKINEIEEEIRRDFDYAERVAVPLEEKVQLYYETSKKSIVPVLKSLLSINNKSKELNEQEVKVFDIKGRFNLTEKSTFTNSGVAHLNFHSFLPDVVSRTIIENLSSIFYVNSRHNYYVAQEDAFNALDKLKVNEEKHVIILFGNLNFDYYKNNLKIKDLSNDEYKGIKLIHYPISVRNVGTSFFILKKKHLPWVIYNNIQKEHIDLYELQLLEKDYQMYATVSDLNTNVNLKEAISKNVTDKELEKYVYQGIDFNTSIKFSKKLKLVRIQIKGYFDNGRSTDNVNDIKKF